QACRAPAAGPQGRDRERRARLEKPGRTPPRRARVCTRSPGYDVLRGLGQARPSDRGERSTPWRFTSGLLIKGGSEDGWQCLVKSQPCGWGKRRLGFQTLDTRRSGLEDDHRYIITDRETIGRGRGGTSHAGSRLDSRERGHFSPLPPRVDG